MRQGVEFELRRTKRVAKEEAFMTLETAAESVGGSDITHESIGFRRQFPVKAAFRLTLLLALFLGSASARVSAMAVPPLDGSL